MADNNQQSESEQTMNSLKIEQPLPVTAVGIENTKENLPQTMSAHRRIYPWFARRPTAATRLAILASILPSDTDNNEILRLMGIGPKEYFEGDIEDYVISREASLNNRKGSIENHFGYDYVHKTTPSSDELSEFHETVRRHWDGDLPTILDPTAGGATIPLEAARYGLPTISNELNPVAWLINKVLLDYAPNVGSLESEVKKWANRIHKQASTKLEEFYPDRNGVKPNHYFRAYSISCPSCGNRFPLTNRWWFNELKNVAIRPDYQEDGFSFNMVSVPGDVSKEEFDPSEGTVHRGSAECPYCGVVSDRDEVAELFKSGDFKYEICGIRFSEKINGTQYHSPTEEDHRAIEKAVGEIKSDLQLSTILARNRYIGRQDRAAPYGIEQWRDMFSPRQLLSHVTYLNAFEEVSSSIEEKYPEQTAEAIKVLLSFIGTKMIDRNTRLQPIKPKRGSPANLLGNNNFSFKWHFAETNMSAGTLSYLTETDNILGSYEDVVGYLSDTNSGETTVIQGDGSDLPLDDSSVEAVVIDPPYGDNVMYSEMSDVLYVMLREYLRSTFPETFQKEETDKQLEAVENPVVANPKDGESRTEAGRREYEEKMEGIFSESHRVLQPAGVITIYFTDKDTQAWDSLTMSLIKAGFTITATHTVTSEVPQRIGMRDRASADSTLLISCRKPKNPPSDRTPTLWSDIQEKTRKVAQKKANELLDSSLNLTKTDVIIGAFGPTLQVFTEEHPVVDIHDEVVRPHQALEEARVAVTEVLIERDLHDSLDNVDGLTRWYILSWLVYERESIPYDEARQLGMGVGVDIDDMKSKTKIWSKSKDTVLVKGQSYRVRDYTALEAGEKRRKRAYPVDPREQRFDYDIDAVHAALNVMETKGSGFAWNWINDRSLQDSTSFIKVCESLLDILPEEHEDHSTLLNLASGDTGDLLGIDPSRFSNDSEESRRTTLEDY